MSKFKFLLISSLSAGLEVVADLCESYVSFMGIVRWAFNRNPNTAGEVGHIGRWVFYQLLGQSVTRSCPSSFTINDPSEWIPRWSKFQSYMQCAHYMKFNLHSLYEGVQYRRTWWSVLCSQMSKFWIKQMDGTFLFSPGLSKVSIGNGSMPDARDVVFSSPSTNILSINLNNTIHFPEMESNNDTLQLMFIDENGKYSFWVDLTAVTRSSGSASYIIPEHFGSEIYPAIKFKAVGDDKIKGIFRFPQGMQPVTILR